jgi:inositol 3-alpha-galactosyltransferase
MAVPRTFKSILTAGLIFLVISIFYLSYSHNLPYAARAGLIGHKHPLAETDDLGLVFPYDPIPRINFASLSKYPPHNINEPSTARANPIPAGPTSKPRNR